MDLEQLLEAHQQHVTTATETPCKASQVTTSLCGWCFDLAAVLAPTIAFNGEVCVSALCPVSPRLASALCPPQCTAIRPPCVGGADKAVP